MTASACTNTGFPQQLSSTTSTTLENLIVINQQNCEWKINYLKKIN